MKSSPSARLARRLATAALVASALVAAGCPRPSGPPAPKGGEGFSMSVTVNPADAQGRRSASVKFDVAVPMPDGQLAFELPKECRILAGAAVRPVRSLGQGKTISQELAFECPAGTTGSLKATFKGSDAKGELFERAAEGAL